MATRKSDAEWIREIITTAKEGLSPFQGMQRDVLEQAIAKLEQARELAAAGREHTHLMLEAKDLFRKVGIDLLN